MACRDYEYDYETWLRRGREHIDAISTMLRQLRPMARDEGLEIPAAAVQWFADDDAGKTGKLSRENFDAAARSLCALCEAAAAKGLSLPAAVVPWWTEHKARDEHEAELAKGLSFTPIYADFWAELAAREAIERQIPGIALKDALRALEKAGLRVLRQGKIIVMTNGKLEILISREDPVNGFALSGILNRIGLSEEAFRKLL